MTAICLAEINTTTYHLIFGQLCLSQILCGIPYFLCCTIITVFSALLNCPRAAKLQGQGPQIKMHFSPLKLWKVLFPFLNRLSASWTGSLKVRKSVLTRRTGQDPFMGLHHLCFWQLTQQIKSVALHTPLRGWILMLHGTLCLHIIGTRLMWARKPPLD